MTRIKSEHGNDNNNNEHSSLSITTIGDDVDDIKYSTIVSNIPSIFTTTTTTKSVISNFYISTTSNTTTSNTMDQNSIISQQQQQQNFNTTFTPLSAVGAKIFIPKAGSSGSSPLPPVPPSTPSTTIQQQQQQQQQHYPHQVSISRRMRPPSAQMLMMNTNSYHPQYYNLHSTTTNTNNNNTTNYYYQTGGGPSASALSPSASSSSSNYLAYGMQMPNNGLTLVPSSSVLQQSNITYQHHHNSLMNISQYPQPLSSTLVQPPTLPPPPPPSPLPAQATMLNNQRRQQQFQFYNTVNNHNNNNVQTMKNFTNCYQNLPHMMSSSPNVFANSSTNGSCDGGGGGNVGNIGTAANVNANINGSANITTNPVPSTVAATTTTTTTNNSKTLTELASGHVCQVWKHNLHSEFKFIQQLVPRYPYIALSVIYPNNVARPLKGVYRSNIDMFYQLMRINVGLLKTIQLAITLMDGDGNRPKMLCNKMPYTAFGDFTIEELAYYSALNHMDPWEASFQQQQQKHKNDDDGGNSPFSQAVKRAISRAFADDTISIDDERYANTICTWQFNFNFNTNNDMYGSELLPRLSSAGAELSRHAEEGIEPMEFAVLMIESGLVLNDSVHWITHHGSYDMGYLMALILGGGTDGGENGGPLPASMEQYFETVQMFLPQSFDLKDFKCNAKILEQCDPRLMKVIEILNQRRKDEHIHAGIDSWYTSLLYQELRKCKVDFTNQFNEWRTVMDTLKRFKEANAMEKSDSGGGGSNGDEKKKSSNTSTNPKMIATTTNTTTTTTTATTTSKSTNNVEAITIKKEEIKDYDDDDNGDDYYTIMNVANDIDVVDGIDAALGGDISDYDEDTDLWSDVDDLNNSDCEQILFNSFNTRESSESSSSSTSTSTPTASLSPPSSSSPTSATKTSSK